MKQFVHLFFVCIFSQSVSFVFAQERIIERVPTKVIEEGNAVYLELVIHKPKGEGPFPTMIFNHGSFANLAQAKETVANRTVAKFFNERGWLVAYPQRRGRGKSDGRYAEGWDGTGHSCDPQISLPGLDRALEDLDAAAEYIIRRPDVDGNRIAVGGHSRGGILSIAYAGQNAEKIIGVVNFSGGWMSENCRKIAQINAATFVRGATYPRQTLWIYAENDTFYSGNHIRGNYDAFSQAGGKGKLFVYLPKIGKDGHAIINEPEQYGFELDSYIKQMSGQ